MAERSSVTIPAKVDPGKLTGLLEEVGWRPVGGRRGVYMRYLPPGIDAFQGVSSLTLSLIHI